MFEHDIIDKCYNIIEAPYEYIKDNRLEQDRFFGYNCIFVPREMLHAAGFIPVKLFGFSESSSYDELIPNQACEFAKNIILSFSEGGFDFLEGTVFSYCCDTLLAATSILDNLTSKVININIPTKFSGESVKNLIIDEIRLFQKKLEDDYGALNINENIGKSLEIYHKNDLLLKKLKGFCKKSGYNFRFPDFLAVLEAGHFIRVEEHNKMIEELITALTKDNTKTDISKKKKIIVSGSLNCNVNMLKKIEELGVIIADDDLCEGSRSLLIQEEAIDTDDPAAQLAERICSVYCPVKFDFKKLYSQILIEKYKEAEADALVFIFFTFCDPQYFEYSCLQKELNENDVNFITLETVICGDIFGQLETRLEAFIESL